MKIVEMWVKYELWFFWKIVAQFDDAKKMGVANSPEIVAPFCLLASILYKKLKILARSGQIV